MTYTDTYRSIVSTATPTQIESAVAWYFEAELLAHDIVAIYENRGIAIDIETASCIISAFSPRQRWARNVVQALEFAHGGTPSGLSNNLKMARNALVHGFSALNGQKTNAFARAISGDETAVTIDVWMCYAAGLDTNAPNKTQYRELSNAVVEIANEIGLSPRATQALIWIIFRGSAS